MPFNRLIIRSEAEFEGDFMLAFFKLAAVAPNRQRTFRTLVAVHLVAMAFLLLAMLWHKATPLLTGNVLLVAGICEGALLIGWRLTQLPKSQALEFLLVTQLQPSRFLLAEALVGIWRLLLVTAVGVPFLAFLWFMGTIDALDGVTLLAMPFVWGLVTGLGITAWAYEPVEVRTWGERLMLVGVLFYLVIGVLVGEFFAASEGIGYAIARFGDLFALGREAVDTSDVPWTSIGAVGIGCGGPLDAERGVLLAPPHLPGWRNVPSPTPGSWFVCMSLASWFSVT